jgi:hypothetical protein
VEDSLKQQYEEDLKKQQQDHSAQLLELEKQKKSLKQDQAKQTELVEKKVEDALKVQKSVLKKEIQIKVEEEQSDAMKSMKDELDYKSSKIKELNKTTIDYEKLKREKDELEESIKAKSEKELSRKIAEEREKIHKEEFERNEFKFKELQKQLEDQMKLTEEMKRKQEQGSMQTQGEVQELAIEDWLASHFPLDTIQEIKKGERGADCLQIIHTHTNLNCGTIYYESKRTKAFQPAWIEKFKADIRDRNANIGVLVTEVMPSDMDRMGLKDGIWICSFDEFKSLCSVLRESIVQISSAIASQENKGDKMGMLYDFLTSNEFRLQIEAIVEGFTQMKVDLESEQRSMRSNWKKREKQIEKVLLNTTYMYGSIKGIAGNAIQSVELLEMTDEDV